MCIRDRLKNLVQERGLNSKVRLVGEVPPADIPDWLSKCDVGILPNRGDVFLQFACPGKLSEFIVMGKAVIVSRLKAIQRYFSEDALVYFEPGNPEDLAKQMVRLYCDPALRARLAAKAKEQYDPIRWERMKRRYLTLIGNLERNVMVVEQPRTSAMGPRA